MYRKAAVLVVAIFVVGSSALVLRQRQLQYAHQITRIHREMDETRRSIWMMQSLVAQQLQPMRLRKDVETKLAVVEPLSPLVAPPGEPSRLAAAPERRGGGNP
jgi:hypothetical protein